MNLSATLQRTWFELLSAVQFLTRIPIPPHPFEADSLSRSVKFFPLVGLLVGVGAALLHLLIASHLPSLVTALFVLIFLVCVTGCFHEDGLADAADGLGGGWNRDQALLIMRDSRIGSYGAAALMLSLLARLLLLSSLPVLHLAQYLVTAHVLCRWTALPLSFYLPPARTQDDSRTDDEANGQGARVAKLTTGRTFVWGTMFSCAVVLLALRAHAFAPILAAVVVTLVSALYYNHRIRGVTGDCFGATNQLTEIAVYLCGVWVA